MELTGAERERERDRLTMLVIVGMRTEEHSLRSQVGIGSDSRLLFGTAEEDL